jgi:Spy/CpxP family protein refolding chaperone
MRKARRCHAYGGCHGHHGWHGGYWGHHGHHGHRRSWMLHGLLARLDASPAQERVIIGEVDKVRERLWTAKSSLRDGRADLGAAIRGPVLDDAALGAVLGRVDAATGEARTAILEALRNIHAVLDDRQRAILGDLLDRGGGHWHGGGSPYRM